MGRLGMGRKGPTYIPDPQDGQPIEVVGPWVQEKHHLLRSYIEASRPARAKLLGSPTFIDLYCGPGKVRIRDTGIDLPGSSLVAIDAAHTCPKGNAAPFAQVMLGDLSGANVTACAARLRQAHFITPSTFVGDAATTVVEVVRALPSKGLHLAFLDPYALFHLPFSIIEELARRKHVDLIILFAAADMARNLQRRDLWPSFDPVAPNWRHILDMKAAKSLRRRYFFDHWKSLFEALEYKVSARSFQVKNTKGREIYRLLAASKHPLGGNIWKSLREFSPQSDMFR